MAERPYTLLSWAMSLDGYLDDASDHRLVLSNPADLDRVDAVRAGCDAILVGAATVRADDPRLVVRDPARRAARVAARRTPTPCKVTLTRHTNLAPDAAFFTTGECPKLVYCPDPIVPELRARLGGLAEVVGAGLDPEVRWVAQDLAARGIARLLVEGGRHIHTQFLADGLADELHVVVAPFFVADDRAPRVVADGPLPWHAGARAILAEVRQVDDVALLRYRLSPRFTRDEPGKSPP